MDHGEICPGSWIYHYYEYGSSSSDDSHRRRLRSDASAAVKHHVEFHIFKYTGDFYYLTKHNSPPIKLLPPYEYANQTTIHSYHWSAIRPR